jgi:hypothetical protein
MNRMVSSVAPAVRTFPATLPAAGSAPLHAAHPLGFALFLLCNAMLFVRPAEIIPALLGWEIYLVCILACLAVSFPVIIAQLRLRALEAQPITICVIGIGVAIVLSHLAALRFETAVEQGWTFLKTFLYFLLFIGLVCTPGRLRVFLLCFVLFSTVVAILATLQYHGYITLPNLDPTKESYLDRSTGERIAISRLQGSGLFQDPNDFCSLLVVVILLSVYWITDVRLGLPRFLLVGPLVLFCYDLVHTQSRGGLLALLAGFAVFLWLRFGTLRTVLIGAAALPFFFLLVAGRQTDLSTSQGTSQERIRLWSESLVLIRQYPLFGIGSNRPFEEVGQASHNSYIHAFRDLGILGGYCFVGAFAVALGSLYRIRSAGRKILDPQLNRLYPYLFGTVAGYCSCMVSLSLCYVLPTYTMLALAIVYRNQTSTAPPLAAPRFSISLMLRLMAASVGLLAIFYVFVRFSVIR